MNPFLAQLIAAAKITGATGVATMARGCATARTAQGIYTVTMPVGADPTNRVVFVTCRTVDRTILLADTSDTVVTITTADLAGADQDTDIDVAVFRV